MVSNRLQDYLPVVTQLLNQSGGSGYNYNPVAPTSVQGGIVETGTRQNPAIRPAIPVSGPNQQIPRVVGTVTNVGMVGRNQDIRKGSGMYDLNPGEVIMNKGTKDAIVVGEGAPRGWFGIPRVSTGLIDFVTKHTPLPDTDWDKRGGGRDYGNLPTEGLGRKPTLKQPSQTEVTQQVMTQDGSIYDPSTRTWSRPSPVMTDADVMKVIEHDNKYRDLTQGSRLAQREADFTVKIRF